MRYFIIFLFSISCLAAKDPDLEDTVFICQEDLIREWTRDGLKMPIGLQDKMNVAYQIQKKKEEKEIQDAMEDAFDVQLEANFPEVRKVKDEWHEVTEDQIERSDFEITILDPVWMEDLKKDYAKMKAKELRIEYEDTSDLKKTTRGFL